MDHPVVDDEDHCVIHCACPALVSLRLQVLRAIRTELVSPPPLTFGAFCQSLQKLHDKKTYQVVHKGILFLAKCYTEGFKCSTDPQSYFGAEPDLSWNDYYDAFDSDDDVDALHMPAEFEDVAADGDSDLH